ncbi:Hydroxyproline-rich glycoprotein family protein [Tripterygium wilfordii]|uniref:Hydroxyproline-rich glycoprotein family protein n=1 Tax=Tripterygium wilfordii TaxID=458696 RepID=A0A7J7CND1_TRIWF|nr:uncharacterized protein LOC119980003 [Tripterygium wilfordii]XP_038678570.1 uncharacterized protein LOC119980003 [Tripterygium wilfordii]XP_038678571.1 uncharacterized protein LOC119980003 [Tripterygium wilfordii]XP_038678572.1 uncharacterized protein LOC119980003 [Tripterygium wilfordii]KAF5735597.1 Hydroxyproline-rich glycoprotein family protein [Tripterygium wilfordii]
MENSSEPTLKSPIKTKNIDLECNTPPPPSQDPLKDQNFQSSGTEKLGKIGTPDRLKVPKAFNYPERYRSPTDSMMSPVSKGLLLAKNRKGSGMLLPPSLNHTKIQDVEIKDVSSQVENIGTLYYKP